ncbi:MAG: tetratricopeptide repeat protein, partial [Cyanobacteria bacterium J06558_2]
AIESYDRAIELNSDEYKTWNNRGISLDELGKYELAIESYDRAIELNPNDDLSYFNRAEPLFKLNLWQEGFGSLEKGLSLIEISSESYLGDLRAIISIIFEAKQERETWQERINTLVELYDQYQAVAEVGQGITDNIPQLFSDMISDKAAQTWLEVWQEAAETKPELEIALRFLKTAVEYKEKSGDSKVLLQLPKEERDLFITLLPNSGE